MDYRKSINIYLSSEKVFHLLGQSIVGLVILTLTGIVIQYLVGDFYMEHSFQILTDLDEKFSILTWYSSSALLLCSLLLLIISIVSYSGRYRYSFHWGTLAFIFLFLSLDKSAEIHHAIKHDLLYRLPKHIHIDESFLIALVFIVLITFLLFYWNFLRDLPNKIKRLFFFSSFISSVGILGINKINNYFIQINGEILLFQKLILLTEEVFEILGIVLFIYALISYIGLFIDQINISFDNPNNKLKQSKTALEMSKRFKN